MTIVRHYIFKQTNKVALTIISGILLIVIFNRLMFLLNRVDQGNIPKDLIVQLTIYQLPEFIGIIIPITLLLCVVVVYFQMVRSHQISIFYTFGFSRNQILSSFAVATLPFILLGFVLLGIFSPIAKNNTNAIIDNVGTNPKYLLRGFKNFRTEVLNIGVKDMTNANLNQPFFMVIDNQKTVGVATQSATMRRQGDQFKVTLNDSQILVVNRTEQKYQSGLIGELNYDIDLDPKSMLRKFDAQFTKSMATLYAESWQSQQALAALLWVLSIPISFYILLIFTLGCCKNVLRQQNYGIYFVVLLVALLYNQLLLEAKDTTNLHPLLQFGLIHSTMALIAVGRYIYPNIRRYFLS